MKYILIDCFRDLEFHDCTLRTASWEGDTLIVSAGALNLHKDSVPGGSAFDMELDGARLTFDGFCVKSVEPSRVWKKDVNGAWYSEEPQVIHEGAEARSFLAAELENGIDVLSLTPTDDGDYELAACGLDPHLTARIAFSRVTVEWEGYCQKAWYELHRQFKTELTLSTAGTDTVGEVTVFFHDEDVYFQGQLRPAPTVTVGIRFDGRTIWGEGKDAFDALADLKTQLPMDVTLCCCLTCRRRETCRRNKDPAERESGTRCVTLVCSDYEMQGSLLLP